MKRPHLLTALSLCTTIVMAQTETLDANWEVASIGIGTKPAFDFDAQGNIHVMGMTEINPNGVIWYAHADRLSGPWQPVVQSIGYFYGPGDLRVDPAGTVHIDVHDHIAEDNLHIALPSSGPKLLQNISAAGHDGWDSSLAIGPDGTLHLASINPSDFGATNSLEYGTFDGSDWTFDAGVMHSGAGMYGLNSTIAIDSEGQPHIAFCASERWVSDGSLRYATRNSLGIWLFSDVVSGIGTGRFPSLALDASNRVHIAWLDITPSNPSEAVVNYGISGPAGWSIQTVDTLQHVFLDFLGARKSVSLALDVQGRPHLAYSDERVVTYARLLDDGWEITPVLQHSADTYNGLVVLRLDDLGHPAIVFWQTAGGNPGRVRMARPIPHFKLTANTRNAAEVQFAWSNPGHYFSFVVECNPDLADTNGWEIISGAPMEDLFWSTSATNSAVYYRVRAIEE